jgi:hypothetical protein
MGYRNKLSSVNDKSFLAFIVSGLLYYLFRKRHLRAIGVQIEDLTKKGDHWDV